MASTNSCAFGTTRSASALSAPPGNSTASKSLGSALSNVSSTSTLMDFSSCFIACTCPDLGATTEVCAPASSSAFRGLTSSSSSKLFVTTMATRNPVRGLPVSRHHVPHAVPNALPQCRPASSVPSGQNGMHRNKPLVAENDRCTRRATACRRNCSCRARRAACACTRKTNAKTLMTTTTATDYRQQNRMSETRKQMQDAPSVKCAEISQ